MLCLRGLLESVESKDLQPAATVIFHNVLQLPSDSPIEIYLIYRTLGPKLQNSTCLREVICRLHVYVDYMFQRIALRSLARSILAEAAIAQST